MNTLRRIMRAKKVDVNQAEIVAEFRRLGWEVIDTHELGNGFSDIVCVRKLKESLNNLGGRTWDVRLIEIKNGNAPYSKAEVEFMEKYPGLVTTVRSIEDVKELFG
jgi:hypothetical protein